MEKRVKYLIFSIVLGLAYFALLSNEPQNKYTAIVKASCYEYLQKQYDESAFLWQAEANFDGYNLFMVKSVDGLNAKNLNVISGEIRNLGKNEMIIGEAVARKWFKNHEAVGQVYVIYGHRFKIKGVIGSNRDIIIAWQENLVDKPWKKVKITKLYDASEASEMVNLDKQLKLKDMILFSYYNENFIKITYNLLCIALAVLFINIGKERFQKTDKRGRWAMNILFIFLTYMFFKTPTGWTQDQLFYDNGFYKLLAGQIEIGIYMLDNGVEALYLKAIIFAGFLFLLNQILDRFNVQNFHENIKKTLSHRDE